MPPCAALTSWIVAGNDHLRKAGRGKKDRLERPPKVRHGQPAPPALASCGVCPGEPALSEVERRSAVASLQRQLQYVVAEHLPRLFEATARIVPQPVLLAKSSPRYYISNNIHREVLPWWNLRSENSGTPLGSYCPRK